MKGMFKRALAGAAATVLAVTGLALGAGAANAADGDTSTITVTGDVSGEGRTFTAYPLASYANPVAGENGCASSVDLIQNTTWVNPAIAEAAATAMGIVPPQYVNNEISYVAAQANGKQLRAFAGALAAATTTKPQGTTGTLADDQVTFDVPSDGWYLIVDSMGSPLLASTKIAGAGDTVYGCLAGQEVGSAVAKPSSIPTPTKTVLDAEGHEVDSVSALVGSRVSFKVTSNVPNHTGYDTYDWQIVDTPSKGLSIDQASVEVTVDDAPLTAGTDYTATVDADGVLTVVFTDVTNYAVNAPITITYEATVTKDAIVTEQNQDGATNSVVAKHDDTESGTPGKVTVKSYGFRFTKTQADKATALDGAKFTVQQGDQDGQYLTPDNTTTENGWKFAADKYEFEGANGVFSFQGLPAGTYYVAETQVPEGYMQNVKATFAVTIADDGTVTVDGDTLDLATDPTDNAFNVMNVQSITQLPMTGAAGTALFTVLGLLIAGAGALVYMKSRNVKHALRG